MMISKPAYADSQGDEGSLSPPPCSNASELSQPTTETELKETLEESQAIDNGEEKTDNGTLRIELPEPDAENITVLTHKLPNKPILPWNRYDSPWEESEAEPKDEKESPPVTEEKLDSEDKTQLNAVE